MKLQVQFEHLDSILLGVQEAQERQGEVSSWESVSPVAHVFWL